MTSSSPDVFVSYASDDRERVDPIVDRVRSAGIGVWLDRQRIDGGMQWAEAIVRGLKGCKVLMLMCSQAAMRSRAVKQEVQLAWKFELSYLPVLLETTPYAEQMQFFLEGCQWVEVLDHPVERWLDPLLRALAQAGVACATPERAAVLGPAPTRPDAGLEGLRAVARFTDRIWPLLVEGRAVDAGKLLYEVRDLGAPLPGRRHDIRLGSHLFWAIDCDRPAHLLLLDQGTEGKTYCLCPSWFVPETRLRPGLNLLPPPLAGCEPFVLTGVPGREHLLALLTEAPLDLGWMPPDPGVPARILDQADLAHLVRRLHALPPGGWTALATYCDVTV